VNEPTKDEAIEIAELVPQAYEALGEIFPASLDGASAEEVTAHGALLEAERIKAEAESERGEGIMRWPKSRFGDSFGGLGNTFKEACANKRKTDEEAAARRLARLKKYQPEAIDISDDGQFVVVSWRMANGEHVSASFEMSSWVTLPLNVREELLKTFRPRPRLALVNRGSKTATASPGKKAPFISAVRGTSRPLLCRCPAGSSNPRGRASSF
jgi:hypothetical protein